MTQSDRILQYMRTKGSITALDAMREFGCMRLAARIRDLRSAGYGIRSVIESSTNMFGEQVNYSRYSLDGDSNGSKV